jgi:hypothetical protein
MLQLRSWNNQCFEACAVIFCAIFGLHGHIHPSRCAVSADQHGKRNAKMTCQVNCNLTLPNHLNQISYPLENFTFGMCVCTCRTKGSRRDVSGQPASQRVHVPGYRAAGREGSLAGAGGRRSATPALPRPGCGTPRSQGKLARGTQCTLTRVQGHFRSVVVFHSVQARARIASSHDHPRHGR